MEIHCVLENVLAKKKYNKLKKSKRILNHFSTHKNNEQ